MLNQGDIMSSLDTQVGGNHYKDMAIQPIEYITANKLGYREGNIVKYISRHKTKGGIEDIKKIIHYCNMILESEYPIVVGNNLEPTADIDTIREHMECGNCED